MRLTKNQTTKPYEKKNLWTPCILDFDSTNLVNMTLDQHGEIQSIH